MNGATNDKPARPHEAPVFDEHETWPEMFDRCNVKHGPYDPTAWFRFRGASTRTVRREP